MPRLADFSGGLNNRLHPTRVPPNQGVEFKNIDNTSGILQSAKTNKPLPDVNTAGFNSAMPESIRFIRYPAESVRNYIIDAGRITGGFKFGARKQYEIDAVEVQHRPTEDVQNLYFIGDVNIPDDEYYRNYTNYY